ncbi:DoxX family protein [Patescibacteria group bacterium]|mgnify:CR=1 FL=1|nr:DoxX family protein [Patescibacteria group bacterium]
MIITWILRIVPALIVLQTLRYKFTGHPESKELFERLQMLGLPEQYGRLGTGILELIFGVLILIPKTSDIGAIGIGILMLGAFVSHLTKLGFKGNNLPLAISGLVALGCSIALLLM